VDRDYRANSLAQPNEIAIIELAKLAMPILLNPLFNRKEYPVFAHDNTSE
jgi:hypothetical protein